MSSLSLIIAGALPVKAHQGLSFLSGSTPLITPILTLYMLFGNYGLAAMRI